MSTSTTDHERAALAPDETGQADAARTVYFISDCHLCADDSEADRRRRERVMRFLLSIDPARSELYIVGDLFDFWFDYRSAMPSHGFQVLATLAEIRRAGLPITFVAGNHDFWVIPVLRDQLGIATTDREITRTLHGRRFLIAHGDGLGSGDLGYKFIKWLFRNPVAIGLYRLIHPDLGIAIATWMSRTSRNQGERDELPHIDRLEQEIALPAFESGVDVAVFGHFHLPILRRHPTGTMMVLGDWITHFTYARLVAGRLELLEVDEHGDSRVLETDPAPSARA